jgi:two-component system response regulator PilR (NtrC family)
MRHIVVVDDEQSIREYLEVLLTRAGYAVELAANVDQFKKALALGVDLVVSDMKLGSESGLEVLRLARAASPAPEVILITAYGTPSSAVEAMRQGAYDYIAKPFDNEELLLLLQKALEKRALQEENRQIRNSLAQQAGTAVVGQSAAMRAVWALVDKVAPTRSTVLITGESGTGKEVIARAIHQRSPRAARPFLAVNCAAIAEGLL